MATSAGATYDVRGDGRYTFSSTYSQYAGKYNESQFGQNTNVGTPDLLLGVYTGPPGQGRDFAPGFDPNNYFTVVGDFPVRNIFFDDNLKSPLTKEFTVGGGTTLGQRGYVKITYINAGPATSSKTSSTSTAGRPRSSTTVRTSARSRTRISGTLTS